MCLVIQDRIGARIEDEIIDILVFCLNAAELLLVLLSQVLGVLQLSLKLKDLRVELLQLLVVLHF